MSAYNISGSDNPFADPSVAAASASTVPESEYNPFDGSKARPAYDTSASAGIYGNGQNHVAGNINARNQGAVMLSDVSLKQGVLNDTSIEVSTLREQNLIRREQLVQSKEKELNSWEKKLQLAQGSARPPNYPICYPLVYHDIDAEIPADARMMMKLLHIDLYLTWCALFWNWVSVFVLIFGASLVSSVGIVYATCYWLLGSYGAWYFWYTPMYKALRCVFLLFLF